MAAEGEGGSGSGSGNASVVENDPYIRYPVELERSLMEGSYDQVWKGTMGEGVPGEEFALFSQVRNHLFYMRPCRTSRYTVMSHASERRRTRRQNTALISLTQQLIQAPIY